MIYTAGEKEMYESMMKERGILRKGRTGSVWQTEEEARAHLINKNITGYEVYGVDANWETDTDVIKGEVWRALNKAADVIRLK